MNELPQETPPPLPSPIAGFWRRVFGFFIDSLILGAFGWVLGLVFFNAFVQIAPWGRLVGFTIALLYFGLMNSRVFGGQTFGKRAAKTKVVSGSGTPLGLARSLIRYLVLGVPYFLNGAPIPQRLLASWLGTLLSIVLFGFGASILYLILFNRRTRQSLHDVIAGSFVLKSDSPQSPVTATVWRGHYVVVAILLIAAAVLPALLAPLSKGEFFKPLLALQQEVQKDPDVFYAGVNEGQMMFTSTTGTKKTTFLTVTVFTKNTEGQDKLADRIATIVFKDFPRAYQKDQVTVVITYGYDIGIASFWRKQPYSFSPQQWQDKLKQSGASALSR